MITLAYANNKNTFKKSNLIYVLLFIVAGNLMIILFSLNTEHSKAFYFSETNKVTLNFEQSFKYTEKFEGQVEKFLDLRKNRDFALIHIPREHTFKINNDLSVFIKQGSFNKDEIDIFLRGNDYNMMLIATMYYDTNTYTNPLIKAPITDIRVINPYYYNHLNGHLNIIFEYMYNTTNTQLIAWNNKTKKI